MNDVIADMLAGNQRHAGAVESRFDGLLDSQAPEAVTVTCSDSRVLADHVWDNDEPGRLFSVVNIGNRVVQRTDAGEAVSGDVLYPLAHTGTETVVVTGHTGCGAVTATHDHLTDGLAEPPGIDHCIRLLAPRLEDGVRSLPSDLERAEAINRLVEFNVDRQVEFLLESDDVPPSVDVVGVVYDFQDAYGGARGEVHVVNVGGERDVETLRERHPGQASRIRRLWEY